MATAEGSFNLRPRTIGELLDQAIRLYRNNFLTYIGIIALAQIPLALLSMLINYFTIWNATGQLGDPSAFTENYPIDTAVYAGYAGNIVIIILEMVFVNGIAAAALTRAIGNSFLGEKLSILEAYRKIGRSWVSVIGALLIMVLISIPLMIWVIIPCVGWLTGPGILMFFWWMMLPLIAPAVVLERRMAWNAIGRAWDLAMKRFWWLLGFVLILSLFSMLVVSGPVVLVNIFFESQIADAFGSDDFTMYTGLQLIFQTLMSLVLGLLIYPLRSAGFILAYFDLRTRFEGFDLALLTRQAEGGGIEADELSGLGLELDPKVRIGANEIGYFIGLTLIVVAIYIALMAVLLGVSALFGVAMGL